MSIPRIHKPLFFALALLLALAGSGIANQSATPVAGDNDFALKAPSFLAVANAQEAAPMAFPVDEVGISAYFRSTTPINLADVRSVYRVIEVETADYIIGSVPVPDWWESYDVHLYVHRDGWFLAYYLNQDVVGKIIDWKRYTGTGVPTKLEHVLAIAADAAGTSFSSATFYDFRYPNASHMMLIVEDTENGNDFVVTVPSNYSYYARSWSLVSQIGGTGFSASWKLDGATLQTHGGGYNASEGSITASQLLPDMPHSVQITQSNGWAKGALVLVYRVP